MQAKPTQATGQPVEALKIVREYVSQIAAGGIPSCSAIRLAAARSLAEIDDPAGPVYWDGVELQAVSDFCHGLKLHDWRNAPAVLHPWQLHLAGCVLARKRRSDNEPATRMLALEVGKGNAKSTTAAMLSLYLMAKTPHRIEVWSMATKRDQAHRVVDNAGNFARGAGLAHPDGPIKVRYRDLENVDTFSIMGSVATKEKTADGLLGRLYLADECGRYTDDTLGKLAMALHKLPDAQLVMFTTPGQNRGNSYYQRRDMMEQDMRAGTLGPDRVCLLYGIDDEDDPFDPAVWPKANPMLEAGIMPTTNIETLAREAAASRKARSEFVREICCKYDDQDAAFVDMHLWDECRRDFDPLEIANGRRVIAAADLSKTHDLTAVQLAVVDDRGDTWTWGHAWTCEHELETRERAGNAPYRQWAELGHLTICKGSTIDLRAVQAYLESWRERVDLWRVYVDPVSGAADTLEEWRREGLPITAHPQNKLHMSPPLQKLHTLIRQVQVPELPHIWHTGCPVLRQCARNTRVSYDWAGNPSAEKDKAAGRIDSFIASVMTMTGVMELTREPISPYESSSVI